MIHTYIYYISHKYSINYQAVLLVKDCLLSPFLFLNIDINTDKRGLNKLNKNY